MAALIKEKFLDSIKKKYGQITKADNSLSLFNLVGTDILIYTRYSKVHNGNKTFFGLREHDLKQLEGRPSVICFLWDEQEEPLLIPYVEYMEVFNSISPAGDGQYKVQIYFENEKTELYIPTIGRFGVDFYYGWHNLDTIIRLSNNATVPELNHSQVQTLIGSIGFKKNYDIWIPQNDRNALDWNIASKFQIKENISSDLYRIKDIVEEIDVVWFEKNNKVHSLFEVEHSTPIYSGLLRFNDIHIEFPNLPVNFTIVSNIERKSLFSKQINRPTFNQSGLKDICSFYDYLNIFSWYSRINKGEK